MTDRRSTPPRADADIRHVPAEPWVRDFVRYLDAAITIPGTNIGVGLDAVVGFFAPVLGDWVGAFASLVLLREAFRRRVPPVIVLRMLLNVLIDALFGMIPVAGDLFDVAFQANKKNLDLLERHNHEGQPRKGDYLVVGLAMLVVLVAAVMPVVVVALVVHWVTER
jgi:hypothetical protein